MWEVSSTWKLTFTLYAANSNKVGNLAEMVYTHEPIVNFKHRCKFYRNNLNTHTSQSQHGLKVNKTNSTSLILQHCK